MRGKVQKAAQNPLVLRPVEEDLLPIPSRGREKIIRKIFEVVPMLCPKCGGLLRVFAWRACFTVISFAASAGLGYVFALMTMSPQSFRTATANPAESLRWRNNTKFQMWDWPRSVAN